MKPSGIKEFIRSMFVEDVRNKAMAFVLALMVWWYAFGNTEDRQSMQEEVTLRCADAKSTVITRMTVVEAPTRNSIGAPFGGRVQLVLEGQKSVLTKVLDERMRHEGTFIVDKTGQVDLAAPENYRLPHGIKIVSADPARILVEVDTLVTEEKPVRVSQVRGAPKAPFKFNRNRMQVTPETIAVHGPSELVRAVTEVATEPIALDGKTGPRVEERVPIRKPPGDLISFAPGTAAEVKVTIDLEESTGTRALPVPIWFAAPDEYRLSVRGFKAGMVLFRGAQDALDEVEKRSKEGKIFGFVRVDLEALGKERVQALWVRDLIIPAGMLPEGVEAIDFDPQNLSYSLFLERSK